ncbi:hypothetical protein E0Z10_g5411 [Xylaria hypoxylon]|uniref:Response regulatory domain-containing protein n=1 Tax=Xylaria hypoxylon TaxID=37992 RepID=A0A4Z0YXY6_9PEZI|nr:hypothetical protein E0Z10_g5411 [Xylaria hypoxylon]
MGNLKERIKATLLRRDSRRLSPSPSKNSFGPDYTSSASTHTQPGYDASDERSEHRVRGSSGSLSLSLSLSQDRAVSKSRSGSGSGSGHNNDKSHTQTPTPDANVSDHVDKSRNKSSQAQARPEAHRTNDGGDEGDFQADRTDSAASGPDPAQAQARVKTSAKTAPPLLQAGPNPTAIALNSNATSDLGKDLQNQVLNSPSSCTGAAATMTTAPSSVASPTTTTNNNTTITTITTAVNNTATHSTVTGTDIATATIPGTPLPSIHEHPAALSPLPSTSPDSNITAPEPRTTTFISAEYTRDDIVSPIDDNPHSYSILTPLTASSPLRPPLSPSSFSRPLGPVRRQSILPPHQTDLVRALLNGHTNDLELDLVDFDQQPFLSGMVTTKIWVKRPLASATLITINEDDLVDDVRGQILRKYANSLGRIYDSPDLTLRICNREQQTSRTLQPDEPISKVIDSYYPNGQTVDDALLIDIPSRRTPKASPNPRFYNDDRPHESGTDYFPPYPPASHSHHAVAAALVTGPHTLHLPPSMSIVTGNQLPPMPSPGSSRRLAINRPNMQRMHTASPVSTAANTHIPQAGAAPTGTHKYPRPVRSRTHSGASSDQSIHPPAAPPIPTPPPVERTATPPPPRVSSPRLSVRTKKKRVIETPSLSGLLDTAVPPINILIVEDNMINLRLLEAFVKRLKVRWQTAVNGREAVDKWRAGGFHLVLMDIQLPIMNGLEATREIRRIEKVNSIGVFSSSASSPPDEVLPDPAEEDKLANTEMFKSPVIIVALTASSLQSDRHEALAAGCNDFLTKPVNFDWLQRKVKEWGCMQALIDFDGWRKWKDFSQKTRDSEAAKKTVAASKAKPVKKNRLSMTAAA